MIISGVCIIIKPWVLGYPVPGSQSLGPLFILTHTNLLTFVTIGDNTSTIVYQLNIKIIRHTYNSHVKVEFINALLIWDKDYRNYLILLSICYI